MRWSISSFRRGLSGPRWNSSSTRRSRAARRGEPASIEVKLNHLTHPDVVALLEEAAGAGVRIRLIVRGTFSVPTENLPAKADFKAISILDRYLEHSRILVFGNGGDPLYYCTSADWMPRNFDRRIEVAFPGERRADQEPAAALPRSPVGRQLQGQNARLGRTEPEGSAGNAAAGRPGVHLPLAR